MVERKGRRFRPQRCMTVGVTERLGCVPGRGSACGPSEVYGGEGLTRAPLNASVPSPAPPRPRGVPSGIGHRCALHTPVAELYVASDTLQGQGPAVPGGALLPA